MRRRNKTRSSRPSCTEPAEGTSVAAHRAVEWISSRWVILAICAASLIVYSNSLSSDFVFDDVDQIVKNQSIRSWDNLAHAFTTHVWAFREGNDPSLPPPLPYYRPLFTAALTIEYHLFGLWPQGWHLFSILLHAICAVEVFWVLLLVTGRRTVAGAAGLLFAVHPVHAESVCWISGMTDPMYALSYLGSFYFYLKWRGPVTGDAPHARKRRHYMAFSIILFLVSAFSKETALSMVALIVGYEMIVSGGRLTNRLTRSVYSGLPYVAASLLYLIPRYLVLGSGMFSNPQAAERPASQTLFTLPSVLSGYLLHLVAPLRLSVTYATRFVTSPFSREFLVPAFLISVIVSVLIVLRNRLPRNAWFGLLLVVVPLVPVLRLGQVSQEAYLVFDHYLYLSVAGWALIAVELLGWAGRSIRLQPGPVTAVALAACLIAHGVVAVRANTVWENSWSLWSNAARVNPGYWAAHYNAGLALMESQRFDEARASLETAAYLKPDEAAVFAALGRAYDGMNYLREAVRAFQHAIAIDENLFEAHNDLGTVFFHHEDYLAAEKCFRRALQIRPTAMPSRYNLGLCYARLGRWEESANQLALVTQQSPDDAEACYELGLVYERMARLKEARSLLAQGLRRSKSEELSGRISDALSRIGETR
jgi:tetratricopeptide (TPR) repeat protein